MELKIITYAYICMLFVSSVSNGILAAPVAVVSSSFDLKSRDTFAGSSSIQLPTDLVLQTEVYPDKVKKTHGTLTSRRGDNFNVKGHWSQPEGSTGQRVVAKRYSKDAVRIGEVGYGMENLRIVDELVDAGVDLNLDKDGWIIMKWKPGDMLNTLPSWNTFTRNGSPDTCKKYMDKVREAILAAGSHYRELPGAPMRKDVSIFNVEFTEEGGKDLNQLVINAYIVDWDSATIDMPSYDRKKVASAATLKELQDKLRKQLETGYTDERGGRRDDFTDAKQCS